MKRAGRSITLIAAALLSTVVTALVVCTIILAVAFAADDDGGYAKDDAIEAIKAAAVRDQRGDLMLDENSPKAAKATPTLSELKRDFPDFWYVVSDRRRIIQYGSVPERVLTGMGRLQEAATTSGYSVDGESMRLVRSFTTEQTDAGEILIEIGGVSYSRLQIAISVASYMTVPIAVLLLATILAAVMVVPVLIVRPVRRVAAAADIIDGAREGVRLPEEGGPLELIPMVSSFNRALERIDAAGAEQRRFLSNAAHELRTPLARARTRVEGVDDPHLKAALVDDLQTLSATVTMLLQLARLSSGAAETREIDLVAIARCVAAEYAPGALKSGVDIEFSGPVQAVKTQGSEQAIRIALSNILRNALRHSCRGQQVLMEVCAPPTVRVIDHGPGIATENKAAVFQPFVRRSDDSDGTGLGLAIVAQVMALHRGVVTIEDTPEGGTTVVLKFAQPTALIASSR